MEIAIKPLIGAPYGSINLADLVNITKAIVKR